jgi:hypothetical protein
MEPVSDKAILEYKLGHELTREDFLHLWGKPSRRNGSKPPISSIAMDGLDIEMRRLVTDASTAMDMLHAEMHRLVAEARRESRREQLQLRKEAEIRRHFSGRTHSVHSTRVA